MKKQFIFTQVLVLFSALMLYITPARCQETDTTAATEPTQEETPAPENKNALQRDAFESNYVINEHTVTVPQAKTLEFLIQHRFGTLNSKEFDMFGLYAPSNIRLGISYSITNRIEVGIGSMKFNKMQDVNWKVALLRQTKSNSVPVSVSYAGDFAIDVRKDIFPKFTDRLSYFHELLIARRVNADLSLQVGATYSYYNILDSASYHDLSHGNVGVSLAGRYKFSPQSAVLFEYAMPLTTPDVIKPNIGIGYEVATSGHAFQVFISTYDAILGQQDYTFNTNDYTKKEILIGFNITRLWGF